MAELQFHLLKFKLKFKVFLETSVVAMEVCTYLLKVIHICQFFTFSSECVIFIAIAVNDPRGTQLMNSE